MLAVLQSLSIRHTERLLGALLRDTAFELIRFQNQINEGGPSVPDAMVLCSCRILVETKAKPRQLDERQLRDHLYQFQNKDESEQKLLVITPDEREPPEVKQADDSGRIVWASFASFDQAIDELIEDKREVVSDREAYLLRELQEMFTASKLIGSAREVLVVAAKRAWNYYQKLHAYVCQNHRAFREVKYLAFYVDGAICATVPKILEVHDDVEFRGGMHSGHLQNVVDRLLAEGKFEGDPTEGERRKVMLLSAPDDVETLHLANDIPNNLVSSTGRATAFTQGQRYVSKQALVAAKTTTKLAEIDKATI
jgi:hypothetical protein